MMRAFLVGTFASMAALWCAPVHAQSSEPLHHKQECWQAAFDSFKDGRARPPITLEAQKGSKELALEYTVKLGEIVLDQPGERVRVRSVPIADILPTHASAMLDYKGPDHRPPCVIDPAAFKHDNFLAEWKHQPLVIHLQGKQSLKYTVRSAIDYANAVVVAGGSVPNQAPYGGVPCEDTNLHTHGLLVPPTRPDDLAHGTFGDYVLTTATHRSKSDVSCLAGPGANHVHESTDTMHHRITLPAISSANAPNWLHLDPHAASRHPEGLYFFHPHPHGYSAMQLAGATSGMITIGGLSYMDWKAAGIDPKADMKVRTFLLRDMQVKLGADTTSGERVADFVPKIDTQLCAAANDYDAPASYGQGHCPDAKEGSRWYFTVNGQVLPLIDDTRPGRPEVWRIVNASPTVSYNLIVAPRDGFAQKEKWLNLQLLAVDGAAGGGSTGGSTTPNEQKFPKQILLMPGARAEIVVNTPLSGGDFSLLTKGAETGGDNWPPIELARIHWDAPAPGAVSTSAADAETTPGGRNLAMRFVNFKRVPTTGPNPSATIPDNPRPYPPIATVCRDLTDHTHERVIHFVKNANQKFASPDLFGLVTAIRPAGTIDASSTVFYKHEKADAPDTMSTFAYSDVLRFLTSEDPTPAFGQPVDASTICAVLQTSEVYSETWVLENWTNEIHNFHMHQTKFQLSRKSGEAYLQVPCEMVPSPDAATNPAGAPASGSVDKPKNACKDTDKVQKVFLEDTSGSFHDTIPIPRGMGKTGDTCNGVIGVADCIPGRVTIEVRFGRPELIGQNGYGDFVFHCHILEHEDRGMMGLIRVIDPAKYRPSKTAALTPDGAAAAPMQGHAGHMH